MGMMAVETVSLLTEEGGSNADSSGAASVQQDFLLEKWKGVYGSIIYTHIYTHIYLYIYIYISHSSFF